MEIQNIDKDIATKIKSCINENDIETAVSMSIYISKTIVNEIELAYIAESILIKSGNTSLASDFAINHFTEGRMDIFEYCLKAIIDNEKDEISQSLLISRIFSQTKMTDKALKILDDKLSSFQTMIKNSSAIILDYPFEPKQRYTHASPHEHISSLLHKGTENYKTYGSLISEISDDLYELTQAQSDNTKPYWPNGWISFFDSATIAAFIKCHKPNLYIEIGSGHSTKMARWAINKYSNSTKLISIDPQPRLGIDALCDEVIRSRLEDVDLTIFKNAKPGDIIFFDGSHRLFQNSDVTAFFMDILPIIPPGVIIHVHDIFLPFDYPESWMKRYYNEQYILGALIMEGRYEILLPGYYAHSAFTKDGLSTFFKNETMSRVSQLLGKEHFGSCFWMRKKP